ncbi:MAG: hypothetical protein EAZ57_09310 [Cytophagales bacterium]|nr:MAG: hypothetical protein EAZ67_10115 [Cytophagales bacterium]TAF59964.1 MAG: hypothetical protein EAZ57_09310 [Cytophagales bacterium]
MTIYLIVSAFIAALATFSWVFMREQKHPLAALVAAEILILAASTMLLITAKRVGILPEAQLIVLFVIVLAASETVVFMAFWAAQRHKNNN